MGTTTENRTLKVEIDSFNPTMIFSAMKRLAFGTFLAALGTRIKNEEVVLSAGGVGTLAKIPMSPVLACRKDDATVLLTEIQESGTLAALTFKVSDSGKGEITAHNGQASKTIYVSYLGIPKSTTGTDGSSMAEMLAKLMGK